MSNPLKQTEGGGEAGLLDALWDYLDPQLKLQSNGLCCLFVILFPDVRQVGTNCISFLFLSFVSTSYRFCTFLSDSVLSVYNQLQSGSRRTDITNITGNHCTKGKALPAILVSESPTHSHMFNTFNRVAFDVSAFPFELKPN